MKAFRILIATVVLSALTLTSCSKDDNNVQVPTSILGKWNFAKTVTQTNVGASIGPEIIIDYTGDEANCNRDYLEFNSDQSARKVIYYKNAQSVCTEDANLGNYTKSGETVTINLAQDEEYNGTFKITKLTSTNMSLERTQNIGSSTLIVTQLLTKAN
ncbi:MAG: lipocalin family protein [Flavobacterium sp.]